ncbi:MAG: hypothetical protein HDKAJFGB_01104 [Anaerolineae bacterium]|nr:hypothetical protein [Anaerolineae bacterium]
MVFTDSLFTQGIRSVVTGGDVVLPCTGAPVDHR